MTNPRQAAIDEAREKARKLIRGPLVGCSDGDTYVARVPSETMLTAALLRAMAQGMRESEHYITRTANRAAELEAMAKEIEG